MEASDSLSDTEGNFCGLPGKLRVPGTDCWPGRPWKKVIIFSITLAQSCRFRVGDEGPEVTVGWPPGMSTQPNGSTECLLCSHLYKQQGPGNLLAQKSTNKAPSLATRASACLSPNTHRRSQNRCRGRKEAGDNKPPR